MADMMDIPVLGVVENCSYIKCPDCGKKMQVFGESHIDEVAKELGYVFESINSYLTREYYV